MVEPPDNTRGFDPDDIEWKVGRWYDQSGNLHNKDGNDLPTNYVKVDWLTIEFTYPDGQKEWRTWSGPFEDLGDLTDHIEDWYDDIAYSINA